MVNCKKYERKGFIILDHYEYRQYLWKIVGWIEGMMYMKNNVLSKEELKAADILLHISENKMESRLLIYLLRVKRSTSKEIVRNADIVQSEVSVGTRKLIEKGWIKISLIKNEKKGRPHYKFFLAKSKKYIIDDIMAEMNKKIYSVEQDMRDLHDILQNS